MRRFVTGGVFCAGVVFLPIAMSPTQSAGTTRPDYRNDARLESLRRFFHQGACPVEAVAEVFLETADAYDLDWRLLPSLSFVESAGGKGARYNNMFGWDSGRAQFPSVTAGIHEVGYRLSHSDLYRAKSLDQLLLTYNPNPDYGPVVKSVMQRIHPTERVTGLSASLQKMYNREKAAE